MIIDTVSLLKKPSKYRRHLVLWFQLPEDFLYFIWNDV